jgi:hypothetical protein
MKKKIFFQRKFQKKFISVHIRNDRKKCVIQFNSSSKNKYRPISIEKEVENLTSDKMRVTNTLL